MNLLQRLVCILARESSRERTKGNVSKANGMALIVLGIFLLPFPIIGLPLIVYGLVKVFS